MAIANTASSYGSLSRALHWLMALLVLSAVAVGLGAENLPTTTSAEVARAATVYSLHKTLGVSILVLALVRLGWMLSQPRPRPLHPERRFETFLAEAVHWALYGGLLVMPLSGWLHHSATTGFAPILWPFGQSLPFVPQSDRLARLFASVHGAAAKLLVATIMLHVAGAVKHAVIDRDGTMARMTLGRPAGTATAALHRPSWRAPLAALAGWAAIIALGVAVAKPAADTGAGITAGGGNWAVTEGTLGLTLRQLGAEAQGSLSGWTAEIRFDEATRTGAVTVTMPLAGLSFGPVTAQAAGPEFFDVANHPTATFVAAIAETDGVLAATGPLTLRGTTRQVTLTFTLAIDGDTATMTGQTILDRRDFGFGPGFPDETSIGFAVTVDVALTATRQ